MSPQDSIAGGGANRYYGKYRGLVINNIDPLQIGRIMVQCADVPVFATAPPAIPPGQNIVLQTTGQRTLILSDAPPTPATGGIILKAGVAMIVVNETGIYISNGQGATITLIGPAVAINQTALTVIGA